MKPFADRFARQAADYADYRPTYPPELFQWLADLAPGRRVAWDCATGNGQAALGLIPYFALVVGTDASAAQLAHAAPHPAVRYLRMRAEQAALGTTTLDLVTAAQALHWFDIPGFFAEARRALRPAGVVAVWCYDLVRLPQPMMDVVDRYYHDRLRDAWAPERRLVDDRYRSVAFPFDELEAPRFVIRRRWTRAQLAGYLRTWSATRVLAEREGRDPVLDVDAELAARWPAGDAAVDVAWDLSCRVGRTARRPSPNA